MLLRVAVLVLLIVVMPVAAFAEEVTGPNLGYVAWLGAGALVVNGSVAVANGLSLSAGTSSRRNGMFGVVVGSTTMALSAFGLATADDRRSQNFSLLLGAAGMASAVTGMLSIKFAGPTGDRVTVAPMVDPFAAHEKVKAGLQLKIRF